MLADNTSHLRAATARRQQTTRRRATNALDKQPTGTTITIAGLARTAGVARSWIYTQPDLIARVTEHNQAATRPSQPTSRPASDDSWRHRAEAARKRIHELTAENTQLRAELARALGELRTTHPPPAADSVHHA